jgi:hypothetical protein
MALPTFPRYRVSPCLDSTKDGNPVVYLVQIKRSINGPWMGCFKDSKPLLFDSDQEASSFIHSLTHTSDGE